MAKENSTLVEEFHTLVPGTSEDPYSTFEKLREHSPVFYSDLIDGWVVSRWSDVTRVLEDTEYFTPMEAGAGSSGIYGRTILHMSGEEHRKKSGILARRLRSPKRLAGDIGEMIRGIVQECGNSLPRSPEVADVKGLFTSIIPLDVIGELMAMREATAFPDWYHQIVAASVSNVTGDPSIHQRGVEAREDLFTWLEPEIVQKKGCPTEDLFSDLCTTAYEEEMLSNDEIKSFCAFILSAGIETTDRALVNLYRELIQWPEQWMKLQDNHELVPSAVAEILRYRQPVQGAVRKTRQEISLNDVRIPEGVKVMCLLGAANHDPTVFENPKQFVVDRFDGNHRAQFTRTGDNRAFGGGSHYCTGSLIAKIEMEESLRYILENFKHIEFDGQAPKETGFYLRSSDSLKLKLSPKGNNV
jgi:cytochrome P450